METITDLIKNVPIPKMVKIRERYDESHIPADKIAETVTEQLSRDVIASRIQPGMRIAITCGSRGIANIAIIVRAIVDFVKECGANPFVFPAMGSHGGATPEGQLEVLRSYHVTEETMGCPIRATMETVYLGDTVEGKPVYSDKYAHEADGVILCGRIKPHTSFRGPYESGLLKMAVIGMGKQHGAYQCHKLGFKSMAANVKEFAGAIIEKKPNMFAIGLIENAYHQTCRIEAIPAGRILEEEPPLLEYAKSRMAKVPFDQADILFVDETGKDISGAGMDPNVTGRSPVLGISRPFFQRIAVFDLTDKSHGNFGGLGSADVTTQRLYRKIDFEQTYPNGITAAEPLAVRLPAVMPSDRTAMQFALRTATDCDWEKGPRIVWLKNTLSLSEFYISEALIPDAEALDNVTIVSEPMEVIFDEEGNVKELR